jgi:hypothetical protein
MVTQTRRAAKDALKQGDEECGRADPDQGTWDLESPESEANDDGVPTRTITQSIPARRSALTHLVCSTLEERFLT